MAVISINQNNFKEEVQAQQGIMLLDFGQLGVDHAL